MHMYHTSQYLYNTLFLHKPSILEYCERVRPLLLLSMPLIFSFKVTSQGQILGAIVATDQMTAQAAARKVEVEYEDVEPVIVSIEVHSCINTNDTAYTCRYQMR